MPDSRPVLDRRASITRHIVMLFVAFAAVTAAVLTLLMLYLRTDAIESGEKVLAGFAALANEQTTRTLQSIEQTLRGAESILSTAIDAGPVDKDQIRPQFRELIKDRPFLTAIVVVDRDGLIVSGREAADTGRDISDRDYFTRQRDKPEAELLWGVPIKARSTGDWIITVTLPIRRASGEFDGLIVGSVPLAFFDNAWEVGDDIHGLAISLWRDDGILLMRSPFDERVIGSSTPGTALFSRIHQGQTKGQFEAVSQIDGLRRLIVFRRLSAYPDFILSFTQSLDQALVAWWRAVWIVAVGWAIAMTVVGGLGIWIAREWRSRSVMEDRYRMLFDANPSPLVVADRATRRLLAANDAAVRQYGWSRRELLAMTIDDLSLPEDVPALSAERMLIESNAGQVTPDLRQRKKDGTIISVERNVRQIDFEGRPAVLTMLQDVTTHKAAEQHSAQMEGRYRGLLEAAPDAMVVVNQAGEIVLVNVQAEKQFGYRRDELLGQKVTNIIPEGFAERLVTDATRSETDALAQEIGTGIELSGRRKDGSAFPIEIMLSPLESTEGILVTAAIRNISVRKGAEEHLTQIEGQYRGLLEAAPDAMVVVNQAGEIVLVNVQAEKQFGYPRNELLGQKVTNIIPEGFAERLVTDATRSETDALAQEIGTGIELSGRRRDGADFPIEIMLSPLASTEGILVTAAIRNISVRKGSEEQLRQAQKMEAVGQLTGGIAHDFNNILFVILANTDALLEEENFSPDVAERLGQIDKAVQRASELTRQLLAFSRKQPLRPQRTDLNELVTDTGNLLRRSLGAQIEIEAVLAEDLCVVSVDRSQFETALVNLCINARDAMPGGGRLLIETHNVTLDAEYIAVAPDDIIGDYAVLTITDNGGGIAPETLDKVFEPFFTTKEVGKGTGLGLSMVYGFIKQSKGHIRIYSELGVGTSIKLYLPRIEGLAEEVVARDKSPMPHGVERVLVVEDEPQVRENIADQLRSLGYTVSVAHDGEAGVAALEAASSPYDLLLTDVVMPGPLNGKLLADEVARRWPTTRIAFMSGFTETSNLRHGLLDEGALLLSKPFRKADLARIIRQVLDVTDRPAAAVMAIAE